jgi:hypothetical protein
MSGKVFKLTLQQEAYNHTNPPVLNRYCSRKKPLCSTLRSKKLKRSPKRIDFDTAAAC